jgi:hypothetical protein
LRSGSSKCNTNITLTGSCCDRALAAKAAVDFHEPRSGFQRQFDSCLIHGVRDVARRHDDLRPAMTKRTNDAPARHAQPPHY